MDRADLHVSLSLQTRLSGGQMSEDLRSAARAAAEAAALELAEVEFGGGSASVDYRVEVNVRTVPQSTPADRRNVVVASSEIDESDEVEADPDNDFGDEGVPDLAGTDE